MKVHTDIASFTGVIRPVVTIGTFDGLHRGHRVILERVIALARREQGESVLFTFHPHPRMVLFPGNTDLKLLSTPEEKAALLEQAGIDHLLVIPFSRHFSRMHAPDYVQQILVDAIGAHAVVIGYDHRFGRNREGDMHLLHRMGDVHGFSVEEIPAQQVDHVNVSSTKVRHALLEGDIRAANELLGYSYPLSGVVVKGDQIGRTLGYPTANIGLLDPHKLVPADGVFAVQVELRDGIYSGMLYIGQRPSVVGATGERSVEVNIFDLDRDLYGEPITVRFRDRIRGDLHFIDLEELKKQLAKDKESTMRTFT